jgi:hypothetical protein
MSYTTMTLKRSEGRTQLPTDFVPGKYAVLCGRGSKCTKSTGNQRLKSHVLSYLKAYSEARRKKERTTVVSKIIAAVKEDAPDGSFVKLEDDGVWWELDDSFAREKVGSLLRESLHTNYRSSTKAKYARRKKAAKDRRMLHGKESSAVKNDNRHYESPMPREIFLFQQQDDGDQPADHPHGPGPTRVRSTICDHCSKSCLLENSFHSKRNDHPQQPSFIVEDNNVATQHSSNPNWRKSKSHLLEEACNLLFGAPVDDLMMADLPDDMSEIFEGDF